MFVSVVFTLLFLATTDTLPEGEGGGGPIPIDAKEHEVLYEGLVLSLPVASRIRLKNTIGADIYSPDARVSCGCISVGKLPKKILNASKF